MSNEGSPYVNISRLAKDVQPCFIPECDLVKDGEATHLFQPDSKSSPSSG